MTGSKRPSDSAKTAADDRAARLAAALRANLHKRKDQKRARKTPPAPDPRDGPARDGPVRD
jgi:hypothetical protein